MHMRTTLEPFASCARARIRPTTTGCAATGAIAITAAEAEGPAAEAREDKTQVLVHAPRVCPRPERACTRDVVCICVELEDMVELGVPRTQIRKDIEVDGGNAPIYISPG